MTKDIKLAKKHAVTPRTVRNWRLKGAPVDDPKKLKTWLASRRSVPPKDALPRRKTVLPAPGPLPSNLETGANAALRRLEGAEAVAFDAMQRALASGDPGVVRFTRDGWLRTSEALRKQDLAVAADRRDSGELVSRDEVIRVVTGAWCAMAWGVERALEQLGPWLVGRTHREIHTRLEQLGQELDLAVLVTMAWPWDGALLPKWVSAAIIKTTAGHLVPNSVERLNELLGDRAKAFEMVVEYLGKQGLAK